VLPNCEVEVLRN